MSPTSYQLLYPAVATGDPTTFPPLVKAARKSRDSPGAGAIRPLHRHFDLQEH